MLKTTKSTNSMGRPPARNEALDRALFLLSRPASLAAMAVLLLNDHLLRRLWPSWWTGKLGDFAWLYFIPFAATVLFALLLPRRLGRREDLAAWLAFGTIGGVFSLAKTLPVFHAWLVGGLGALLGFPVGWRQDPTDLMALISLAAAWVVWQRYIIKFNFHPGPATPPLSPPRQNGGAAGFPSPVPTGEGWVGAASSQETQSVP